MGEGSGVKRMETSLEFMQFAAPYQQRKLIEGEKLIRAYDWWRMTSDFQDLLEAATRAHRTMLQDDGDELEAAVALGAVLDRIPVKALE